MIITQNKKINLNYDVIESFEAGIQLKGTEIKSLRNGSGDLRDTFAVIKNNEVFLINMYIAKYEEGNRFNHEERRTRKLLLHKREIKKLREKIDREGYSLVPVKAYLVRNKVKVLLGVGKGKKNYDKRETIKERDLKREAQRMR